MSDNRSTITYSPSFGYDLAARRINGEAVTLDLSRLRVAGIGGDMVRADVLDNFAATLSVAGFRAAGLPAELRHGRDDAGHFLRRCRHSRSASTRSTAMR